MPELLPNQHVHFVGIGGTGLSAIARVLLDKGLRVSGSDRALNAQTAALARDGADIHQGHDAAYVDGADLVIVSSAVAADHVEVTAARARGLPVYKRADVIDAVTRGQQVIAVAGTHGKTTTTAMTAHILCETGRDPSYIIGGVLRATGRNAGFGGGPAFVIEADEYDHMFLGLRPQVAVVTNAEWDHPDFFATPDDLTGAFRRFAALLPPDGLLIACADDPTAAQLAAERRAGGRPAITYGIDRPAAWQATNISVVPDGGTAFDVIRDGAAIGRTILKVVGRHHAANALAALIAAASQGVAPADALDALRGFEGTDRRFEVRADVDGVAVVDDYAHHPTAIRVTLEAARAHYPDRTLWAVWQPHTYSRAQQLTAEFARAFAAADHVLVTDIYAAREQPIPGVTSAALVAAMPHPDARHTPTLDDAAALLADNVRAPAAIVILSAGDAPQIGVEFLQRRSPTSPAYGGEGDARRETEGKPIRTPALDFRGRFRDRLLVDEPLAKYTAARLGGPADLLYIARDSLDELAAVVLAAWNEGIPVRVLGGGANVLVPDRGIRGLVVINGVGGVAFHATGRVTAASGVGLGPLARRCAARGLSGFEWAVSVPGTVGGAVVNNAGAHGGDMAGCVREISLLEAGTDEPRTLRLDELAYGYRASSLKERADRRFLVLSATLGLTPDDRAAIEARMEANVAHRKATQPPGASLGSIFKNPPGDYAGRLIESAGLKGVQIGGAQVSTVHANFFVNSGSATAADYFALIAHVRDTVYHRTGVLLELEIETPGEW